MKPGEARQRAVQGEVGAHDVACSVFLARHSAYIDGELQPRERAAHERHQAACGSCARYARVVHRGVDVLRELPELEPSADFEARLQHRLFHVQDEGALAPRRRLLPWLAAAAVLAGAVTGERLLDDGAAASPQALTPAAPQPLARVAPTYGATRWQEPVLPPTIASTPVLLHDRAYSPVVVRPPQFRPVSLQGMGD